jgi:hypothetical protein
MITLVDKVTDLRNRLAIPYARLDELNSFLLDPDSRVVNDILAVIARYGTPEEINRRSGPPTPATSPTWSGSLPSATAGRS